MVETHRLSHNLGALCVFLVVLQAHLLHGVEHAPVYRLQSVTHIRQRAANDNRHGVVEIRSPHLIFNVDGLYVSRVRTATIATRRRR
jgi:hypothetical protein